MWVHKNENQKIVAMFRDAPANYTGGPLIEIEDGEAVLIEAKAAAARTATALVALADSDIIVMRCMEAKVTLPSGWKNYREALRNIVRGVSTSDIPDKPEKPSGLS